MCICNVYIIITYTIQKEKKRNWFENRSVNPGTTS